VLQDRLYTEVGRRKTTSRRSGADGRLENHQRAGAPACSDIGVHARRRCGNSSSARSGRTWPASTSLSSRKKLSCGRAMAPEKAHTWELLAKARGEVLKGAGSCAQRKKLINSGLEAKYCLNADLELKAKLKQYLAQLPGLFIVSQVELLSAGSGEFSFRGCAGTRSQRAARGRKEMRPLLELFRPRWREPAVSGSLRALQRSHRRKSRQEVLMRMPSPHRR